MQAGTPLVWAPHMSGASVLGRSSQTPRERAAAAEETPRQSSPEGGCGGVYVVWMNE